MSAVADRDQVLAYADEHGTAAASEQYGVSPGTIRSWRSRAGATTAPTGDAPGVEPGSPGYVVAKLSAPAGSLRGPIDAYGILTALTQAEKGGAIEGGQFVGVSGKLVCAWQARAAGQEPDMPDNELDYRLGHALSQLPRDVRAEIALDAERQAWQYLSSDRRHHRIVAERAAQEHQQAAEKTRQERQKAAEIEARDAAEKAEHERVAREQRERQQAQRVIEQERQAAESERMRRASEDLRRNAA